MSSSRSRPGSEQSSRSESNSRLQIKSRMNSYHLISDFATSKDTNHHIRSQSATNRRGLDHSRWINHHPTPNFGNRTQSSRPFSQGTGFNRPSDKIYREQEKAQAIRQGTGGQTQLCYGYSAGSRGRPATVHGGNRNLKPRPAPPVQPTPTPEFDLVDRRRPRNTDLVLDAANDQAGFQGEFVEPLQRMNPFRSPDDVSTEDEYKQYHWKKCTGRPLKAQLDNDQSMGYSVDLRGEYTVERHWKAIEAAASQPRTFATPRDLFLGGPFVSQPTVDIPPQELLDLLSYDTPMSSSKDDSLVNKKLPPLFGQETSPKDMSTPEKKSRRHTSGFEMDTRRPPSQHLSPSGNHFYLTQMGSRDIPKTPVNPTPLVQKSSIPKPSAPKAIVPQQEVAVHPSVAAAKAESGLLERMERKSFNKAKHSNLNFSELDYRSGRDSPRL